MIPILYDFAETDFTSQGVGRLSDCISCTVKEVINGEYEMEFQYPVSGSLFGYLVDYGGIVCAEHDHNGDLQPFEIYRYSAPIDGIVTFNAHHISYRLSNVIVRGTKTAPWSGYTPAEVFEKIPDYVQTTCDFTFKDLSGYTQESNQFSAIGLLSVRDAFLNGYRVDDPETGSAALYQVFPGEFEWDKFNVKYYRRRGGNNGLQIRYGKNLTEITRERDTSGLVSAVFPFWIGKDENEQSIIVNGPVAMSPYVDTQNVPWTCANDGMQMQTHDGELYWFGAADFRATAIDFSSEFNEQPTQAQLRQAALDYMSKNSTWRPYDNITVRFVDLYNASEYEEIRSLEKAKLGDYVSVYYTRLGVVAENVEIVSATYDVLADSFVEMELGQIQTTFADALLETIGGMKR